MSEEKREFSSGVTSTKQPRLSLIPYNGLINAARRFELGIERHGEKAWNNLSTNQKALLDKDWLIERISHSINHGYNLIDLLKNDSFVIKDALGDAGAIAWCGLVLGEAITKIDEKGFFNKKKVDDIIDPIWKIYHTTDSSCSHQFKDQLGNNCTPLNGDFECVYCKRKYEFREGLIYFPGDTYDTTMIPPYGKRIKGIQIGSYIHLHTCNMILTRGAKACTCDKIEVKNPVRFSNSTHIDGYTGEIK